MEIRETSRGMLQIDDATITFKNFSGRGSQFNRDGDRNFALVIPDVDVAEELKAKGWNVKIKPGRDDPDEMFCTLPVKVKYNGYGPNLYLQAGEDAKPVQLTEDTVHQLDQYRFSKIDMDLRPYNWEVNGKTGTTAYISSGMFVAEVDRFAAAMNRFTSVVEDEEDETPF